MKPLGPESPQARPAPPLRVILVGRQSARAGADTVESRLRRDAGIELIRARDPLDAIAELRDPLPTESIAPPAVIALPGAIADDDQADFAAAVALANPAARLLGFNGEAHLVDRLTPESLRSLLGAADAAPPARARRAPAAAPSPPRADRPAITPDEDDAEIIRAMIAGSDIAPLCIARLRERLRDQSAEFVGAGPNAAPDEATGALAPVANHGIDFGFLRTGAHVPPLEAARAAEWLALWLTLRDQHAQLRQAAFTDPLTGVWNRRYFDRFLPDAIERARAARHELSLLIFDVDNFKKFNDRYGHAAGDEILTETVRLLRSVVRPADRVCRIGGDEFAVIFYEPEGPREPTSRHPARLSDIAARFQAQIFQQRFPKLGAHAPGALTISGGMATFPWDASDAATLIARADALAMESKSLGKNTIKFGVGRPTPP